MTPFEDRYQKLNADQKRAVDAIEGAVLVVAGPGSGKTEILALRVARILQQTDVGPGGILCLTFTDSAASNMRARLASLIGPEAYRVTICTFHSFAQQVAQQYPAYFANGAELVPSEAIEQRELVAEAIRDLPLRDVLRSEHPSEGLTYVGDAVQRISELKKAGISPTRLEAILAHNAAAVPAIMDILAPFGGTVSKKQLPVYAAAAEQLLGLPQPAFPMDAFPTLAQALGRLLESAVMDAEAGDSSAPITAWKSAHLAKDGDSHVLKSARRHERLVSLAKVYARYQELLTTRGLRDYDDLIVDLIDALHANHDLRAEVQEEYQYLLVDEFQDTNGAQAELLALLADSPVAEGNPNLMVVGDDDQAIYRFHGAGLEHLLGFAEKYKQATVVTMATNYRSHQAILDLARTHIDNTRERLVGRIPGLTKVLTQGSGIEAATIGVLEAGSRDHERDAVASLVRAKLDAGVSPEEIAIIGRRNRDLEEIVPYLASAGIRVSYDRQRNALDDAHVIELVELARIASRLSRGDARSADPLLPRALAFPFWGIPRADLWALARQAHEERTPWLDLMLVSDNEKISSAAKLLVDIGSRAENAPAEQLVDELVGMCDTPDGLTSPFRDHYFGAEARTENPEQLLLLVSALRSVLNAFREARRGQRATLEDFVQFVDLHREHNTPVSTRIMPGERAVHLLTGHKAKGQEFEVVIVLHATTDVWHGKGRSKLISFPENVQISPAGDSLDDQLRNLYVAVTRAKSELYFATAPADSGRGEPLPILEGLPRLEVAAPQPRPELAWALTPEPIAGTERDVLLPLVTEYQLTATQLNDFLDVIHGGPQFFFDRYVLRYPQHQSDEMRFGNAMHAILEKIAIGAHQGTKLPTPKEIPALVTAELTVNGFSGADLAKHEELGTRALTAFITQRADELKNATHVEVSFAKDKVVVGEARLTGKADVIREEDGELVIIDYKTGKASADWEAKGKEATRLGNRRQLLFYAILAQNSPRFAGKRIKEAKLTFVVPDEKGNILDLTLEPEPGEVDRVALLAQAVHKRVMSLDFPDISAYPKTLQGILDFEEYLLTDIVKGR